MNNVEVQKNEKETATNMIRRFTKRIQDSGVLRKAKSMRFHERSLSDRAKKERALKRIARREQYEELAKLGKLPEKKR